MPFTESNSSISCRDAPGAGKDGPTAEKVGHAAGRRAAPAGDDGAGDLAAGPGSTPRAISSRIKLFRRDAVDIQFGGFGNEFDVRHAGGKGVVDPGGALLDFALLLALLEGDAPEQFDRGALDGAGREVVAAELVELGGGALGLPADGVGQGERDRGQGGGDPQDDEEGAAAAGGRSASWPVTCQSRLTGSQEALSSELEIAIRDLRVAKDVDGGDHGDGLQTARRRGRAAPSRRVSPAARWDRRSAGTSAAAGCWSSGWSR